MNNIPGLDSVVLPRVLYYLSLLRDWFKCCSDSKVPKGEEYLMLYMVGISYLFVMNPLSP